jgi:hypothetical protein
VTKPIRDLASSRCAASTLSRTCDVPRNAGTRAARDSGKPQAWALRDGSLDQAPS